MRPLREFCTAIVGALPNLLVVFLVILLTRFASKMLKAFFARIETGEVSVPWMTEDTARPTRKLTQALLWLFAIAMAYPYFPGSNTEAFKGLSVLVGIMLSIGGAGVIGQAASGLIMIYSRVLREGEYVEVRRDQRDWLPERLQQCVSRLVGSLRMVAALCRLAPWAWVRPMCAAVTTLRSSCIRHPSPSSVGRTLRSAAKLDRLRRLRQLHPLVGRPRRAHAQSAVLTHAVTSQRRGYSRANHRESNDTTREHERNESFDDPRIFSLPRSADEGGEPRIQLHHGGGPVRGEYPDDHDAHVPSDDERVVPRNQVAVEAGHSANRIP